MKLLTFLLGSCIFLVISMDTIASPYECTSALVAADQKVKIYLLELITDKDGEQDEGFFKIIEGFFKLINNGSIPIKLKIWQEGDSFYIHGHSHTVWYRDKYAEEKDWEATLNFADVQLPADAELVIMPGESFGFVASVTGRQVGLDILKYMFRLSIRTADGKEIVSEPYCFSTPTI